jgi:hypothetical protein
LEYLTALILILIAQTISSKQIADEETDLSSSDHSEDNKSSESDSEDSDDLTKLYMITLAGILADEV